MKNPATKQESSDEDLARLTRLGCLAFQLLGEDRKIDEQIITMIRECISEGIVTESEIVDTVSYYCRNRKKVKTFLEKNIGYLWNRDGDRFSITPPPLT